MSEEIQNKEASERPREGNNNREASLIEQAHKAAERLEAAHRQTLELIERQEALQAREILGGKSEGAAQEVEKKPETPAEYAKRIMRNER